MEHSYNGWPASKDKSQINIVDLRVTINRVVYAFPGGCKGGDVHTIFTHFLMRYHAEVESLGRGHSDEWGFCYRPNKNNPDEISCHGSGTAIDVNASEHPNGKARTLTSAQVVRLRRLLDFYEGVIKWGGDFQHTKDEMHYEIHGGPTDVARIARKIKGDGHKTIHNPYRPYMADCHIGDKGNQVSFVEWALGQPITGSFDANLKRLVTQFQTRHTECGKADGWVGVKTRAVLDKIQRHS